MVQPRGSREAGNSRWWWYSDAFPWNINPLREYREQKGSRWLSGLCAAQFPSAGCADHRWAKEVLKLRPGLHSGVFFRRAKAKPNDPRLSVAKTEESWQDVPETLAWEWKPRSETGCPDISDVGLLVFGSGRLRLQVRGCLGAAGSVWGAQGKDTGCPRAASSTSCLSRRVLRSEGNATGRLCPSSSGKIFLINRGST